MRLMNIKHYTTSNKKSWAMVEFSDKLGPLGEGNGKIISDSCLEKPMNSEEE